MKKLVRENDIRRQQGRDGYYKISNNEFCKCIGSILSEVTYGKKGYIIWESNTRKYFGKVEGQIDRDVRRKIDLLKVIFTLYNLHYSFLCH